MFVVWTNLYSLQEKKKDREREKERKKEEKKERRKEKKKREKRRRIGLEDFSRELFPFSVVEIREQRQHDSVKEKSRWKEGEGARIEPFHKH